MQLGLRNSLPFRDSTVDLANFACSNYGEFLILVFFTKFRVREFSLA